MSNEMCGQFYPQTQTSSERTHSEPTQKRALSFSFSLFLSLSLCNTIQQRPKSGEMMMMMMMMMMTLCHNHRTNGMNAFLRVPTAASPNCATYHRR